jgi:hypothetical protein
MKQSKYSILDYWRTKINQNEELWSGLFENQPISRDSVIINPVILNSYSNQMEDAWAVYPNPQSVLGFLKLIYLPTAFIGLIKEEMEYQYYLQEDLGEILAEYKKDYPDKLNLIMKMEAFYYEFNDFWVSDNQDCLQKLKQWSKGFNENWEEINGVSLSFNVFSSPKETINYIIEVYEEDLGIEMLEDDIGLTKGEFIDLAGEEIYRNDFMKRKFTEILTNRLKVTF